MFIKEWIRVFSNADSWSWIKNTFFRIQIWLNLTSIERKVISSLLTYKKHLNLKKLNILDEQKKWRQILNAVDNASKSVIRL